MNWIPFLSRFHDAIVSGDKTYTLRTKCYGDPGDILRCPVGKIRLLGVEWKRLGWVRDNLWMKEGCSSPQEFEDIWRELHNGRFKEDCGYWLHHFQLSEVHWSFTQEDSNDV